MPRLTGLPAEVVAAHTQTVAGWRIGVGAVASALGGRPVVVALRCRKLADILSFSFCSTCK